MEHIQLGGPGLGLTFEHKDTPFRLLQIQRSGDEPMLRSDPARRQPGPGPIGNPLALVIRPADPRNSAGQIHHLDRFLVDRLEHTRTTLEVYLSHDQLPLNIGLSVTVEGHVATWRGQVIWNGDYPLDVDVYYPLFSRLCFTGKDDEYGLVSAVSGQRLAPLDRTNFRHTYPGNISLPGFMVGGGGRGLTFLDENRAEYATDPGPATQRAHVVGNRFPLIEGEPAHYMDEGDIEYGGDSGPFAGICHTRMLAPAPADASDWMPEARDTQDIAYHWAATGDAVDLGPVMTYAHHGTWRVGAEWMRRRRVNQPMRRPASDWYRRTTFISEDMGDAMVRRGESFHDFPALLQRKRELGSDLFHIPGFHEPEVIGSGRNWLNRGDYLFAADNLGGIKAAREGIRAIHRAGGRLLYYVEGLIVWKRSRIGRSDAREWALMKKDGTYDEHYTGFWHMCPACIGWQEWFAETCARIVESTGVDGFFIDSTCATYSHRCFNPRHNHPHPDVWAWGVRQLLSRVRQAVDRVNPQTLLFVEGVSDLAGEFVDGFISHGHSWSRYHLQEPLVRFTEPRLRVYESWANRNHAPADQPPEYLHTWNSVTGHRIYAHAPESQKMACLGRNTRRYYDMYPEICDSPMMSIAPQISPPFRAELFDGPPQILTVGNLSGSSAEAHVCLPMEAGMLFDRVDSSRIPVVDRTADFRFEPWQFRAFEVRP